MKKSLLKSDVQELLINLSKRIVDISNLYKNNQLSDANERIVFLIEDLLSLLEAISIINDDYKNIVIEELQEKLQVIHNGILEEDYYIVADLLIFELLPVIELWRIELLDA